MSDWQNPLPLRLIVMADFGLPCEGGPAAVTAAGFDEALSQLKPAVKLTVRDRLGEGDSHEITVDLSGAAGFHPDHIVEGFPALAQAAAELKAVTEAKDPAAAKAAAEKVEGQALQAALGLLLKAETPDDEVKDKAVAAADAVLGAQLDAVLHHPDLQRVEAAWRGLRFLLDGVGEDGNVIVEILPALRTNLVDRFRTEIFDPEYAGVDVPVTSVLLDFDFDHRAHFMGPLEELAELGRILQVMLVASTGPELFGLKSLLHLTALKDLSSRLAAPIYKRIQEFQKSEDARWTTVTLNRALLRSLYEPGVGGVESFAYREKAEAARPESYLWGRGIWIFGRNLAQSFSAHGHCADVSGNTGAPFHQGLPVREVPISATETAWSSVEVAIDEANANALTRMGMTTLVGRSNANFAYFPLLANMYRNIPGHLSLNGAVAHQLFAGHLSHYTLKLLASAPRDAGDEEIQAHFHEGFTSFLGPIGGEGAVSVDVGEREGNGRTARIQVKPSLSIEEKEIDLTFELPL